MAKIPRSNPSTNWQRASVVLRSTWATLRAGLPPLLMLPFGRVDVEGYYARDVWSRRLLAIAEAELSVEGADGIDWRRPHVVVSNHLSGADIPVLFCAIPAPVAFVAKKEVARVPILGPYMRSVGMVFLDRGKGEKAMAAMHAAAKRVHDGRAQVVVFAEGKRSADGYVRLFKRGAFVLAKDAGVPVVPVAITGSDHVLPARPFDVRGGEIKVRFGAPISADEVAALSVDALRDRCRASVVAMNVQDGGRGGLDVYARRKRGPETDAAGVKPRRRDREADVADASDHDRTSPSASAPDPARAHSQGGHARSAASSSRSL